MYTISKNKNSTVNIHINTPLTPDFPVNIFIPFALLCLSVLCLALFTCVFF